MTQASPAESAGRKLVRNRSLGLCECCGTARAVHKHHRVNRSQGGSWAASNLLDACSACHDWIGAEPVAARTLGWHLLPGQDPAREWCRIYGQGWVHLDDLGGYLLPERSRRRSCQTRPG